MTHWMKYNGPDGFAVVHPLDDAPETKRAGDGLGRMPLRGSVTVALWALRGYLVVMAALVVYHLLEAAGLCG